MGCNKQIVIWGARLFGEARVFGRIQYSHSIFSEMSELVLAAYLHYIIIYSYSIFSEMSEFVLAASPSECTFLCLPRCEDSVNVFPHTGHAYGRSPVCTLK